MRRISAVLLAILLSSAAHAAEYMEKTPFQLSRAFSPGVITSGGTIVWVAGQTATQDSQGNNIANNFEAQVKQVFAQIDGVGVVGDICSSDNPCSAEGKAKKAQNR